MRVNLINLRKKRLVTVCCECCEQNPKRPPQGLKKNWTIILKCMLKYIKHAC